MNLVVNRRRAARRDLVDVFDYYIDKGSIKTARRFLAQAESTFQRLAKMPSVGALYEPDDPVYPGLRYMPVSRFRMYLIFYVPIPGGIDVFRILHGARDLESTLEADFE